MADGPAVPAASTTCTYTSASCLPGLLRPRQRGPARSGSASWTTSASSSAVLYPHESRWPTARSRPATGRSPYAAPTTTGCTETYLQRQSALQGHGADPDAGARPPRSAELRRAVRSWACAARCCPSTDCSGHLGSKEYWPVYEEADRLGCCLAVHGGCHERPGHGRHERLCAGPRARPPLRPDDQLRADRLQRRADKLPERALGLPGGRRRLAAAWRWSASSAPTRRTSRIDPRGELLGPRPGEQVSDYVLRQIAGRAALRRLRGRRAGPGARRAGGGRTRRSCTPRTSRTRSTRRCAATRWTSCWRSDELTDADKAAILHGNAERFYGLARGASRADATARGLRGWLTGSARLAPQG